MENVIIINNTKFKDVSPLMTSDSTPAPYVTNCSIITINKFYYVFDRDPSKLFRTNISTTTPFTASLDYGDNILVNAYRLDCSYDTRWTMKSWTFEGSNDESTWIVLDSQSNIDWTDAPIQNFVFDNVIPYRYYRLNVSEKNGTNSVCINELYLLQEIVDTKLSFKKVLKVNLPDQCNTGEDTLFFTEDGDMFLTDKKGSLVGVGGSFKPIEYTSEEIDSMFDTTPQELEYYSSIINDNIVSTTKLWSSDGVKKKIAEAIMESNAYTDSLLSDISRISLQYVTGLPEYGESNIIYILKATDGGNDTLNLYNIDEWVTIGEFNISLDNYYDKLEIDTLLNDKADKDTVFSINNIVSNLDNPDETTVLSTMGLKNKLSTVPNELEDYTDNIERNTDYIKGWYNTTCLKKYGSFISFNVNITVKTTESKSNKYIARLGTVPEVCRPSTSRAINAVTNNGVGCYFWLDADGKFGITLVDTTKFFTEGDGIRICLTFLQ